MSLRTPGADLRHHQDVSDIGRRRWAGPARQLRAAATIAATIAVVAALGLLTSGGPAGAAPPPVASMAPSALVAAAEATPSPAPTSSSQLITVNSTSSSSSYATLSAWQKGAGGHWVRKFGPVAARVGATGIGRASEGSEHTPRGTFPLTVAFGRLANPGTRMAYFKTDPLDWWDENPSSPTYNLHVRRSSSPGGASENLYYSGSAYNYAVNIGYNLARVPGAGSAFFLHVNTGESTAGCVSIDQGTLQKIVRWLDRAQHPYIDIRVGAALTPTPVLTSTAAGKAVSALYQGILGHAADPAGLAARRTQLLRGGTMSAVAAGLARSTDKYTQLVTSVYAGCLGRKPDPGGRNAWVQRLAAGTGLSRLDASICASGEAWSRAGGNSARWIATLYRTMLGRTATAAGIKLWQSKLAHAGRFATAFGIATSAEFGRHQLAVVYLKMLGRNPSTAAGKLYGPLMLGRGFISIPSMISRSTEFWIRSQR